MSLNKLHAVAVAFIAVLVLGLAVAPAASLQHTSSSDNDSSTDSMQTEATAEAEAQTQTRTDDTAERERTQATTAGKKKYKKKKRPTPPEQEQPEEEVRGQIQVCKVLVNKRGNVIRGQNLDATFQVDARDAPEGVSSADDELAATEFNTPLQLNADLNGNGQNDARCQTQTNLSLGNYFYDEEQVASTSDRVWFYPPRYNDQFRTGETGLNDFTLYDDALFNNDTTDDENRSRSEDGHIRLTEDNPNRTLVVLNRAKQKKKKKAQPQPQRGELNVCKLLTDNNGSVIRGTSIPDTTFSSDLTGPSDFEETFSATTPLNLNADLNDNNVSDSRCTTYDDLPLGTYEYSEEAISGDANVTDRITDRYNDDFTVGEDGLASFANYTDSATSDGEVELTQNNSEQTLVIHNVLQPEEQEQPTEPNVTQPKKKKKGKKMMPAPNVTDEDEQAEEDRQKKQRPTVDEDEQAEEDRKRRPAVDEDEQAEEERDKMKKRRTAPEDEMADEDELSEEENASNANVDQTVNNNIEQEANVDAMNGSDVNVDQAVNNNIEQEASVEGMDSLGADIEQTVNNNIEQTANVDAAADAAVDVAQEVNNNIQQSADVLG